MSADQQPSDSTPPQGYRPCAGAVVFNRRGLVFVARRRDLPPDAEYAWQLPQGGMNSGENPEIAARRELFEETGIQSVTLISTLDDWLIYDFPPDVLGKRFKKYRGQAQRWFAYEFEGMDTEINLDGQGKPEFDRWDWVPLKKLPSMIVPFKRDVYAAILEAFLPCARSRHVSE